MINLVDDIARLTDVSEKTLNKFIPIANYCISHALYESQCKKEELCVIDLGYGEIHLKTDDNCVYYKFIPSKELEKLIIQAVTTKTSPMIFKLDTGLQEKIDRAYKELL